MQEISHKYDDMINAPRPRSSKRAHMSDPDRAAQFSPFAALTGYDDAVKETARLTDARLILDENEKELLNEKLALLRESPSLVIITYFRPDESKAGGSYVSLSEWVRKIDLETQNVQLENGNAVLIEDIVALDILAALN